MIRYTLAVVVAVVWLTSEAAAIECAAEAQSRTAYWSWRIIDGKRCWYPGRPGMSKANLHWPTATVGQRGPAEPDSAFAAAVESDTDPSTCPHVWRHEELFGLRSHHQLLVDRRLL